MNLSYWIVDLVLVAVILLCAFVGHRKGALATLISLVGGIAALVLALLLSSPVSRFVSDTFLQSALQEPIAVADTLAYGVTFFVLLIVFLIVVRILISLAKKFNKIPLLGGANRTLGLVLGLLQGLVFAWAVAGVFHLILPYLQTLGSQAFSGFDEEATVLYRLIYRFNPITFVNARLLSR